MTLEQKWAVISAIPGNDPVIRLNIKDEWYVGDQLEIGGDGFLRGAATFAEDPHEAIHQHYSQITNLKNGQHIYCRGKRFTWMNNCVWSELKP